MSDEQISTGKLLAALPEEPKRVIGRAIIEGLVGGRFTFTNPIATEGGDYNQNNGGYTQSGGGNHTQGSGDYSQAKLTGNLGRLDITDLAEIIGSIKSFER